MKRFASMMEFPLASTWVALALMAGNVPAMGLASDATPALLKPIEGASVSIWPADASVRGDISGVAFRDIAEKPTFARLLGTKASLKFARPVTLRKIALPRIGWADWALPKTVHLSINGGSPAEVTLSAPRISPGKYLPAGALEVDVVDFGKEMEVAELSVEVVKAEAERGSNPHGTIRVAIPAQPPLLFGLKEADAVPPDAIGVTFEVESDAPVSAPLFTATARQFRVARSSTAPLPPLPKGKSQHVVRWSDLTSDADAPAPISPRNFYEFGLEATGSRPDWRIVSWQYLRDEKHRTSGALESVVLRDHVADAEGRREGIPEGGFGRFGWVQSSGLLVGSLLPDGLAHVIATDSSGKPLKTAVWKLECGNATTRVWERTTAGWTHVQHQALYGYSSEIRDELAVKEPGLLQTTRTPQMLTGSILAPGVLIDSNDSQISLSLVSGSTADTDSRGWILYAGSEDLKKNLPGEIIAGDDLAESWIVVSWAGVEKSPMLLTFKKRPKSIVMEGDRLTVQFFGAAERLGAGFLLGYVSPKNAENLRQPSKTELANRARQMAAILRAYPVSVTQQFREVEGEIEIKETTRHSVWENDWNEPAHRIAPLPPLLAFAAAQGYPVQLPEALDASFDWPTKYGPYRFVNGNTLTYRMAIPSPMTRIYPQIVPMEPLAEAVAQGISSLIPLAKHPLSSDSLACFKGWASSSLAWPLMPTTERTAFLAAWRERLNLAFGALAWYLRREPFSGATYPVSFAWIEPDTATLADVNSGIGAILYSLDAYASLSGDWKFAREKWPQVRATLEYFLLEHDWCQMQTAAREHSGSSAIDMDCIGYQGVVAFVRMAEKLGFEDDAAYGRFLLARTALPLNVRWLGHRWMNPEADPADLSSLGIGLSENTGFDLMSAKLDPNYVNSQTALMLSWLGQFPEVYDAHLWGTGQKFFDWFERDYVEKKLPDWRKQWPGNRNNHPANVSAHLYLRALLGFPQQEIRDELGKQSAWGLDPKGEVARENAPLYALLLAADSPVILRDWGQAKPEEFQYDPLNRTARLRFASTRPEKVIVEIRTPAKSLMMNDQNVPTKAEAGLLHLDLPVGESIVSIAFDSQAISGPLAPLTKQNHIHPSTSKSNP